MPVAPQQAEAVEFCLNLSMLHPESVVREAEVWHAAGKTVSTPAFFLEKSCSVYWDYVSLFLHEFCFCGLPFRRFASNRQSIYFLDFATDGVQLEARTVLYQGLLEARDSGLCITERL